MSDKNTVQGEGDHQADREYREKTRNFVDSGKVEQAAREARKSDSKEAMDAEKTGKQRAREEDPQVHREHDKPTKTEP